MFPIKDLPPVERRADGSLYRMDAGQRREAVRLIKGRCSYYDGGNCLYLDDGEEVTSASNNAKYCPDCRAAVQRRQKADYARKRRVGVEK